VVGSIEGGIASARLDIAFLKIDAALFTEEMGIYPGDKGRSGLSVQAAIRFGR